MYSHLPAIKTWLRRPFIIAVTAGTALAGALTMSAAPPASAAVTPPFPVMPSSPTIAASPRISIPVDPACPSTTSGTTITLTASCTTTETLTVPAGFTLNGDGHTITANDPTTGNFEGPVVTNVASGMMNVENLTIKGGTLGPVPGGTVPPALAGLQYTDASGDISGVTVLDISRHGLIGTPNDGYGIRVLSSGHVTITGVTVEGFQRAALMANGNVTVDASGSTFGPPDLNVGNPDHIAQNPVEYSGGAGGVFSGNTIIGTAFGGARAINVALLLFSASHFTASHNTFGGVGSDSGIGVVASTSILIEFNHIARDGLRPGFVDTYGFGAFSNDAQSTAQTTLICNTFAGWNVNLVDLVQHPCITSTSPLRAATLGVPYTNTLSAFTENPDAVLTWSLFDGTSLPPGLMLHSDGTITGTPTKSGTFTFTAQVCDTEAPDGDSDGADNDGCTTMVFSLTVGAVSPTTPPPSPEVSPSVAPVSPVPSGPVVTGGGKAGSSPWLPYGGLAAGIGLLLTIGGLVLRRKGTGA